MKKIALYFTLLIAAIISLSILRYFNVDLEFTLGGIFGILIHRVLEMEE